VVDAEGDIHQTGPRGLHSRDPVILQTLLSRQAILSSGWRHDRHGGIDACQWNWIRKGSAQAEQGLVRNTRPSGLSHGPRPDSCRASVSRSPSAGKSRQWCDACRGDGMPPLLGIEPLRPRARAAARPARVRSRMSARSNSARAANRWKVNLPLIVLVSMPSVSDRSSTPRSSSARMSPIGSDSDRQRQAGPFRLGAALVVGAPCHRA
jgi:hypothetical protein